jgi:hypothetical protein
VRALLGKLGKLGKLQTDAVHPLRAHSGALLCEVPYDLALELGQCLNYRGKLSAHQPDQRRLRYLVLQAPLRCACRACQACRVRGPAPVTRTAVVR